MKLCTLECFRTPTTDEFEVSKRQVFAGYPEYNCQIWNTIWWYWWESTMESWKRSWSSHYI